MRTALPSSPAADADPAFRWWRASSRRALAKHATRVAIVAAGVVVVGAIASAYLAVLGWQSCDDPGVCVDSQFYAFTVQRSAAVTTVDGARTHRTEWFRNGNLWLDGGYDQKTGARTGHWREMYADGTARFDGWY